MIDMMVDAMLIALPERKCMCHAQGTAGQLKAQSEQLQQQQQHLAKQEAKLQVREAKLQAREQQLQAAAQELNADRAALTAAEAALQQSVHEAQRTQQACSCACFAPDACPGQGSGRGQCMNFGMSIMSHSRSGRCQALHACGQLHKTCSGN